VGKSARKPASGSMVTNDANPVEVHDLVGLCDHARWPAVAAEYVTQQRLAKMAFHCHLHRPERRLPSLA
jgi:hypothetical protein